jgi:predicted dehydrogenase
MTGTMEPLRLGVQGCGRVFERFHLPAIARTAEVQLISACDVDLERLRWAAQWTPRPTLFHSLPQMLERADLDALLVLTPPIDHAASVVRGLEAGLHVLVEKPMALAPDEGRRMVDTARQAGKHLQVGYNRRFRDPYRWLRISLGDPAQVHSALFELSVPTASWKSRSNFLGDDSSGGGALDDVLSHQVDLLSWLLGTPDRVRVVSGGDGTVPVRAELRFDGTTAHCTAAHGPYREHLEIELSDGKVLEASGASARAGRSRSGTWRRRRTVLIDRLALLGNRIRRRPNVTAVSFERQLRDFARAARGGEAEGASGEDALVVVEVVQACRASAKDGGRWHVLPGVRPAG